MLRVWVPTADSDREIAAVRAERTELAIAVPAAPVAVTAVLEAEAVADIAAAAHGRAVAADRPAGAADPEAVADTREAVAVSRVAAAVASRVVEAVDAGKEIIMNTNRPIRFSTSPSISSVISMTLLAFILTATAFGQGQGGKTFPTADDAANALIAAAETYDTAALLEILGPNSRDIIQTGEPVRDKEVASEFAKMSREKKTIAVDRRVRNRAFLEVGEESWPFPVPIVKVRAGWVFDTNAGRQEILFRRIGSNELDAIQICYGYVEAQKEYALKKHDGALVNQYAQKIISSPGKQDGLAWQNKDGSWGGTVGENAAKAIEKSYTGSPMPFHGYHFKILKKQGPAAGMGAMDFMIKDAMIGGFALVAYPSVYNITGIKTFMVSHEGVVYEKDLGPDTATKAAAIDSYNPDRTWVAILDD